MILFRSGIQSSITILFILSACSNSSNSNPDPSDCGNNICNASENCASCPSDCGCPEGEFCSDSAQCKAPVTPVVCGNGTCENLEDCSTCPADCACEAGESCTPAGICEAEDCTPQCPEQECVPDRCGGVCGSCVPENVAEALIQTGIIAGPALAAGEQLTFDVEVQEETEIEMLSASNQMTQFACNFQAQNLGITLHALQNGQVAEQVLQTEAATGYQGHTNFAYVFTCKRHTALLTPGQYRLTLTNQTDDFDFEESSYVIEARRDETTCGDGILNIGEACDGPNVPGSSFFQTMLIDRCQDCVISDSSRNELCFDNNQRPPNYRNISCGQEQTYCRDFNCKEHFCGDGVVDFAVASQNIEAEECDLGARNGVPNSGCDAECRRAEVTADFDIMRSGIFNGPAIEAEQSVQVDFTVEAPTTIQILPAANVYSWASCSRSASNLGLRIFTMQDEEVGEAVPSEVVSGYRSKNSNLRCEGITANLIPGDYRLTLTNSTGDTLFEAGSYVLEVRAGHEAVCDNDVLNIGEPCDGPNVPGAELFQEHLIDRCENCQIIPSESGDRCYENADDEPDLRNISCLDGNLYCRKRFCTNEDAFCSVYRCQEHVCGDGIVDPAIEDRGIEAEECDLGDRNGTPESWCSNDCNQVPIELPQDIMQTGFFSGPELPLDRTISVLFSSAENTSIEIQPSSAEFTRDNCNYSAQNVSLAVYKILENGLEERVGNRVDGYGNVFEFPSNFACQGWAANLEQGEYKLALTNLIPRQIQGRAPIEAGSYLLEVRVGEPVCGNDTLNIGEACDGPNVPGVELLAPLSTERCIDCQITSSAEGEYCFENPSEEVAYRNIACSEERNYCRTEHCFEDVGRCDINTCLMHECGNGIVDPAVEELALDAEECDLGDQNGEPGSGCNINCQSE